MEPLRKLFGQCNRLGAQNIHGLTDAFHKVSLSAPVETLFIEASASTSFAPSVAVATPFAPPQSLFTFEMHPSWRTKAIPKMSNSTEAFSNTRIEISGNPKDKKKMTNDEDIKNGGTGEKSSMLSQRSVSEEKTRQSIASGRESLEVANNDHGDSQKSPPHDFSGELKYLLEDTFKRGGIAIDKHGPTATANNNVNTTFDNISTAHHIANPIFSNANTSIKYTRVTSPDHFIDNHKNIDMGDIGGPQSRPWTAPDMDTYLSHLKHEQDRSTDPSFTPYDDAIRELRSRDAEHNYLNDSSLADHQANSQQVNEPNTQPYMEHAHSQALYGTPPPANSYYQPNLGPYSSPGLGSQHQQHVHDMYSSPGPFNPHQNRAADLPAMPTNYNQGSDPSPWDTQTQYAQTNAQGSTKPKSLASSATAPPDPSQGHFPTPAPLPDQTPSHPPPQSTQHQRKNQTFLREDTPLPPPRVYGAWPNPRELNAGGPSNPLTWEELITVRKVEDELRRTGVLPPKSTADTSEGLAAGTGNAAPFGQQHTQPTAAEPRIRDFSDRSFRDTNWEHTLRPSSEAWAYDTRYNRVKAQHVCRCALCQRMGKWFENPKPTHLEGPPIIEELGKLQIAETVSGGEVGKVSKPQIAPSSAEAQKVSKPRHAPPSGVSFKMADFVDKLVN